MIKYFKLFLPNNNKVRLSRKLTILIVLTDDLVLLYMISTIIIFHIRD